MTMLTEPQVEVNVDGLGIAYVGVDETGDRRLAGCWAAEHGELRDVRAALANQPSEGWTRKHAAAALGVEG